MRGEPRTWRNPYRGTTRHAQSAYPFMVDPGLGHRGALIGLDGLGRTFCHDPFALYEHGLLHGPNMLVLGDIGYGKSALVKLYLYRQALFGYACIVVDVKGEYDRLCEALGVTPLRIVRGGVRLNPLDEAVGGVDRLTLLRSIAELLLGRGMYPREDAALDHAYTPLERRRRQPTIPQVVSRLLRPERDAATALETTIPELSEWGRDLALALRRLEHGDLAGLFSQETTSELAVDSPMTSVNLAHAPEPAKPILMACVAAWLRRAWANKDGHRRIIVQEEAWHLLAAPGVAAMQQANLKLARQYGCQNILVMHHLGDLHATGDKGSRIAGLAAGLLADTSTRVLYHLDPGELHATADLLGLTGAHRQVIPRLQRGSALWLVEGRPYVVHHQLAPAGQSPERWIVDTDQAMLGRPATTTASGPERLRLVASQGRPR